MYSCSCLTIRPLPTHSPKHPIILHSLFLSHHTSTSHSFPQASHHSPFPVPVSPHIHFPLIPPSIPSFSIPCSCLTTHPLPTHSPKHPIILHSLFLSHHTSTSHSFPQASHHSPFPVLVSPHIHFPLIPPSIQSFSIPCSCLTTHPLPTHSPKHPIILHSLFLVSPHIHFPLIPPSIPSFSIPCSCLTTHPLPTHSPKHPIILHSLFLVSPHIHFPLIPPSIPSFSILCSCLTTHPLPTHSPKHPIILHSLFLVSSHVQSCPCHPCFHCSFWFDVSEDPHIVFSPHP